MDIIPDDLEILQEAADFYYEAACLHEDVDLDPEDHLEVVLRAFLSSDCDAFAQVLSDMTGWPTSVVTWSVPVFGFGHHTVCVSPDGSFVDIAGRLTLDEMAERYGVEKSALKVGPEGGQMLSGVDLDDEGRDRIERVIGVFLRELIAPLKPPTGEMINI